MSARYSGQYPIYYMSGVNPHASNHELTTAELLRLREHLFCQKAIRMISHGVSSLKFAIIPPHDEAESVAEHHISQIKKGLHTPNGGYRDMYFKFVRSVVSDLITYGVSIIERKKGTDLKNERGFWMWPVPNASIKADPDWIEGSDSPRFWYAPDTESSDKWQPLEDEDIFLIQRDIDSDKTFPPSPLQLACRDLKEFSQLRDYQRTIAENDNRDGIIFFEDAGEEEVIANREYFESEEGSGRRLVVGGKVGYQALSAQRDEEMFLEYTSRLVSFIGIYFDLNQRDLGYLQEANRATADIAATASFQQAILPVAQVIISHLHYNVVDFYYPGYSLELQDVEPRNEESEANRASILFEKQLATKNEARGMIGLDSVPGGDEFKEDAGGDGAAPPVPQPPDPEPKSDSQPPPKEENEKEDEASPPKKGKPGEKDPSNPTVSKEKKGKLA